MTTWATEGTNSISYDGGLRTVERSGERTTTSLHHSQRAAALHYVARCASLSGWRTAADAHTGRLPVKYQDERFYEPLDAARPRADGLRVSPPNSEAIVFVDCSGDLPVVVEVTGELTASERGMAADWLKVLCPEAAARLVASHHPLETT